MKISVIIPARNEADKILGTLYAVAVFQTHPPDEVIVVDDNSTDGTGDLVRTLARQHPTIRLNTPPRFQKSNRADMPINGKSRACDWGASHATGNLLVFLDADVFALPHFVATILGLWTQADLYPSFDRVPTFLWPRQVCKPLLAKLCVPFVYSWKAADTVTALGQCFICDTPRYRILRPHFATIFDPVEDVGMAHYFNDSGVPFANVNATGMLSCSMYGTNKQAFSGLTRVLSKAVPKTVPPPLYAFLLLFLAFHPTFWHNRLQHARVFRHSPLSARFHPLSVLILSFLIVISWFRYKILRRVSWRGRNIAKI